MAICKLKTLNQTMLTLFLYHTRSVVDKTIQTSNKNNVSNGISTTGSIQLHRDQIVAAVPW